MKMFVIKNSEGKFLKKSKHYGDRTVDNVWEASLFGRRCDASNSKNARRNFKGEVVEVEVRVKESNNVKV